MNSTQHSALSTQCWDSEQSADVDVGLLGCPVPRGFLIASTETSQCRSAICRKVCGASRHAWRARRTSRKVGQSVRSGDFLKNVAFGGSVLVDNSRRDVCNRGLLTPLGLDGASPMPTIPQRIASAFAVLCGQYGDVTEMAQDREQSRQSLYREAEQVVDAVDGAAAQARIDELQRQLAEQQAEVQALQERLKHAVEITPDKQHEFATVAQAEGVSLSVARRLLQVVAGPGTIPSVADAGAGDPGGRQHAGALLEVLDEVVRPEVKQGTADEIFLPPSRS